MALVPSRQSLWVFATGLCMGAADLVPGISGGTMAFILGIYDELLLSIESLNLKAFSALVRGDFLHFFNFVRWRFLGSLLFGMGLSFIFFSHSISYLLNHETYRVFLYSGFLGLILASVFLLIRQVKRWRPIDLLALAFGAIAAYFLTSQGSVSSQHMPHSVAGVNPWLILCGALAISAMLLPGISGSYLLMILGVYPVAIEALADFLQALKSFQIEWDAFGVLSNLLAGIIIGALFFVRIINWLLKKHREAAVALLTGFMIGALKTVWPFWTSVYRAHPFKPEKGAILNLISPVLPDIHSTIFWQSLGWAAFGFSLVLAIEFAAKLKNKALT